MYSRRWLIAAVAVCVLASACSEFNTNLTVQTSTSSLSYVSPGAAMIGNVPSTGLSITATGAGFVSTGTYILWNGVQLTNTVYVSSTQLTAVVPASDFATPGTVQVSIQIPGSSVAGASNIDATDTTEVSNIINFTISPMPGPPPTISSVSASSSSMPSTPYCSPNGFTLTVNGTNFANGAVVNWNSPANGSPNGAARATTFVSSTQLTASILATDAAFPGTAGISVSSATGTSNTLPFTMTTPAASLPPPSISSLSQTTAVPGAPTFTLTANGGSFVPCSVMQFGGTSLATSYVNANQLNATVPSAILTAGSGNTSSNVDVTVSTIGPGGGTSAPVVFTIGP